MNKKTVIIISIILIAILGIFIISNFSYVNVDNFPEGKKTVIIRKIKNENKYLNFIKPKANKLISNNDLIVYKNPMIFDETFDKKTNFYSRVLGCPGDTIQIKESQVFVNGKAIEVNYELWFLYRISCDKAQNFENLLKGYKCKIIKVLNNNKAVNIISTSSEVDKIQKIENVINTRKIVEEQSYNDPKMFSSKGNYFLWNKDNIGALVVPKENTIIDLNPRNIGIYKDLIHSQENNNLEFNFNKIIINNQETSSYQVKQNYYFVLNDNRMDLNDSRYMGLIPENQIVGKIIYE